MNEAAAAPNMTPALLVEAMERFISCNDYSRDESLRWFAFYVKEHWLPLAKQVRRGALEPDVKTKVDHFRMHEIEQEQARLQSQINVLATEARKIEARSR
jgi:hypothetical protein